MENTANLETTRHTEVFGSVAPASRLRTRRVTHRRQKLVVGTLVLSDALLALCAWMATASLQGLWMGGTLEEGILASIAPAVFVWVGLRALLGLYPGYGLDHVEELQRQTSAALAALTITVLFVFASGAGSAYLSVLIVAGFLELLFLVPLTRYFVKRILLKIGLWGKPVAIIGSQEVAKNLLKVLQREWQLGLEPVAVYDSRSAPEQEVLRELAQGSGVDTVIFATPHTRREEVAKLVEGASVIFRRVVVMPNLGGITNSAVVARDYAGNFGVEIKHNLLDPWARRIKHVLDLCATIAGGFMISALLIAVVVAVKLDSSGPAFYGHRRLGADGKHFLCWKFRTMHVNAEQRLDEFLQDNPYLRAEWEENFKLRNDPRVTRVGRFLRKTSLDELPQLWNVLRGEMSLVGPRPIVDAEVPKYGATYGMYRRIRPGITGFWQVSGRSDTGYQERVNLDAYYVHNWSVWLDLVILARTVRSVVLSRGAY